MIILYNEYKSKWVWLGNTTITQRRPIHGTTRKSHRTISVTRHQENKQSKATSSLFSMKTIAKLERTLSNAQQNREQTQDPTMRATLNNNKSTTKEPQP